MKQKFLITFFRANLSEDVLFKNLYESNQLNVYFILFSLIEIVTTTPLLYGVILFEANNHNRDQFNQLNGFVKKNLGTGKFGHLLYKTAQFRDPTLEMCSVLCGNPHHRYRKISPPGNIAANH